MSDDERLLTCPVTVMDPCTPAPVNSAAVSLLADDRSAAGSANCQAAEQNKYKECDWLTPACVIQLRVRCEHAHTTELTCTSPQRAAHTAVALGCVMRLVVHLLVDSSYLVHSAIEPVKLATMFDIET